MSPVRTLFILQKPQGFFTCLLISALGRFIRLNPNWLKPTCLPRSQQRTPIAEAGRLIHSHHQRLTGCQNDRDEGIFHLTCASGPPRCRSEALVKYSSLHLQKAFLHTEAAMHAQLYERRRENRRSQGSSLLSGLGSLGLGFTTTTGLNMTPEGEDSKKGPEWSESPILNPDHWKCLPPKKAIHYGTSFNGWHRPKLSCRLACSPISESSN